MRSSLILAATAVLSATPALAQAPVPAPRGIDVDRAGAMLSNPAVQDGLADLIGQVADAVLQTRVGPMAALTDRRDDVRPDDTLGDVVRRGDPGFDRRLRDNTRSTLALTGRALREGSAISRELKATADRLRAIMRQYDRR